MKSGKQLKTLLRNSRRWKWKSLSPQSTRFKSSLKDVSTHNGVGNRNRNSNRNVQAGGYEDALLSVTMEKPLFKKKLLQFYFLSPKQTEFKNNISSKGNRLNTVGYFYMPQCSINVIQWKRRMVARKNNAQFENSIWLL